MERSAKREIKIKITKILVSGAAATGKTSLIAMLLGKEPVTEHNSTLLSRSLRYAKITADSSQAWKSLLNIHDLKMFLASWLNKVDATNEHRQEESAKQEASDSASAEETYNKTETQESLISMMNIAKALDQETIHFIYIIDSGGQPAFQDVLPAFIRGNSVAIHTLKLNENLSSPVKVAFSINGEAIFPSKELCMTNLQLIQTLVRSTSSRVPADLGNETTAKPLCMIVGTHSDMADECSETIEVKDRQVSEIPGIRNVLIEPDEPGKVIFPVNTMVTGDTRTQQASKLRKKITLKSERSIVATMRIEWFLFDLHLRDHVGNDGIISMDECKQIGKSDFGMADKDVEECIEHLHNQTLLLYFKRALPKVIFLDPHSILDKVSAILFVSYLHDSDESASKIIRQIKDILLEEYSKNLRCGTFDKKFLSCLSELHESKLLDLNTTFSPNFEMEDFLKLLISLRVIVKLPNDEYFIPCVLPIKSEKFNLKKVWVKFLQLFSIDTSRADPLCYCWKENLIPLGLFPALVVQLLQRKSCKSPEFILYKNNGIENVQCQFRNAIQLECTSITGIVLLVDSINWMEVHYTCKIRHCNKIRQAIDEGIRAVQKEFGYQDKFRHGFVCRQGAYMWKKKAHLCLVPTEDKSEVSCNNGRCTSKACSPQQYCWFETTTG